MGLGSENYVFPTEWRLRSTQQQAFDVIADVHALVAWWPSVYIAVEIENYVQGGTGTVFYTWGKGFLPYTIKLVLRVIEYEDPKCIGVQVAGDLEGKGVWTFEQEDSEHTIVRYDWRVSVKKPIVRLFTPIVKPIFEANHKWCMKLGHESLQLEIDRRWPKNPDDEPIPGPKLALFPHRQGSFSAKIIDALRKYDRRWIEAARRETARQIKG